MPEMYSSEDLEKFYFDYHTEWMPRGMSAQAYCSRNNLPDKVLDKWIRDIYKRVVPVQVTGTPKEFKLESTQQEEMINRYIEYLISQSESKDLQIRSLEIKIDELTGKITSLPEEKQKEGNRMEELITELRSMNAELSKSRKKIARLEEQLKSAKADECGRKRSKSKDDDDSDSISSPDRNEAEENFDGSEDYSIEQSMSEQNECRSRSAIGQTFNTANRPETYKSMGVNGRKIVHKSDRIRVPEGSRVIETRNFVLYSLEMSLVAHEYEMLHVIEPGKKPVWKYYPKYGHPEQVMRFDGTKATPEFMQALAY